MIARPDGGETARTSALLFAGLLGAYVLNYLFYVAVGRELGPAGYGEVAALFSLVFVFSVPAAVAGTVVAKRTADLLAGGFLADAHRFALRAEWYGLACGCAVALAVALAAEPLARFLNIAGTAPVLAAAAAVGFSIAVPLQRGVLQGGQHFGVLALSNVVECGTRFAGGALAARSFGPTGALAATALSFVLAFAYGAIARPRERPVEAGPRAQAAGSGLIDAAVILAAYNALIYYDTIVAKHAFSAEDAGLYAVAVLAGRALFALVSFAPLIALPKSAASPGDLRLLRSMLLIAALPVAVALLAAAVAPRTIAFLLGGPRFEAAAPLVLPLTAAMGALGLTGTTVAWLIGAGRYAATWPLAGVCALEITVASLIHPSPSALASIVLAGHLTAFATVLAFAFVPGRPRATG